MALFAIACLFLSGQARGGEVAQIDGHGTIVSSDPASQRTGAVVPVPLVASSLPKDSSDALKLLDLIYEGHSLHAFWRVRDTDMEAIKTPGMDHKAAQYGEIQPAAFMQLLQHAGVKPGQKYYDLGSGTGKTVFGAWLLGLDATGIELMDKRWNTACRAMIKAKRLGFRKQKQGPGVNFIHGSFLDLDFSDADVVFVDSMMFSKDMMAKLAKIAIHMKPGSKIISQLGFPGEGFQNEGKVPGPSSWSKGTTWTIQTVTGSATSASSPPLPSSVRPASLMRQEPATPPKRKESHIHKGPLIGNMVPDADVVTDGSNMCSLEVGKSSGIAAAAIQK